MIGRTSPNKEVRKTPEPDKPTLLGGAGDWWNNACIGYHADNWDAYARGYKRAADLLVHHIDTKARDQDTLVYPIIFLYRQYIELRIKHLTRDACRLLDEDYALRGHHQLLDLWSTLRQKIAAIEKAHGDQDGREMFRRAEKVVRALITIDPQSTTFRYPEDLKGKRSIPKGLSYINPKHFKKQIKELTDLLEGIDTQLSVLADMKSDYIASMQQQAYGDD